MILNNKLAIDIGNSRIKLFDGIEFSTQQIKKKPYREILEYIKSKKFELICISSVNLSAFLELSTCFKQNNIEFYNANDLISVYNKIDFSEVNSMGTDRKLGLIAAETMFPAPFITIDFGTAITINSVNADCICEGGFIIPGLYTQSKALNHFTSALPLTELHYSNAEFGRDTTTAINNGILNITLKGVDSFVSGLQKANLTNVITSGGGYNIIEGYPFNFKYIYEPQLVLKGILRLLLMV